MLFKTDYVMIKTFESGYMKRKVTWVCGVPYSYTHIKSQKCKLLPRGTIVGKCYEDCWEPASENMQKYYQRDF